MTVTVSPTPYLFFMNPNNSGAPAAGFKLFTYIAGTSTKQNTWTDSTQAFLNQNPIILDSNGAANVWLDPSLIYKFVLASPTDSDPPTSPLRTVDNLEGPITNRVLSTFITPAIIAASVNPRTQAEIFVGVVPTNLFYVPGDLRRYSSFITGGGDVTSPLQSAVNQAGTQGGAPVYIPASMGFISVTTAINVTGPCTIYGDGYLSSNISTVHDVSIFSVTLQGSGCLIRDLSLTGEGGAATTAPGILYTNANNCKLERVQVSSFWVGVRYATGLNSSYLNTIRDSQIISNISVNIDAQLGTNQLSLFNVTFGGGPAPTGLKILDSNGLSIYGGDCEGTSLGGVEIDNPTVSNAGSHLISGIDFEGNKDGNGNIRIGNTGTVNGVIITGCLFSFGGTGDAYAINPQNVDGLLISACNFPSGYGTAIINTTSANIKNMRVLANNHAGTGANFNDFIVAGSVQIAEKTVTESAGTGATPDVSVANHYIINVTDTTAFAINAPSNLNQVVSAGQFVVITVKNTSGGSLGAVSWNAVFKLATWTSPANANSRTITFRYNGTNWVEASRTPNDVPN